MDSKVPNMVGGAQIANPKAGLGPLEKIKITIPDMFVSFMAQKPVVNPHYEQVKAESEAWIADKCNFDDRMNVKVAETDFSYFSAVAAPDADAEGLRILCDWGNWVFPFDDMFDNGHLRQDPERGQEMMTILLSIMSEGKEGRKPASSLIEVHDTIWQRVVRNSPKGVQRRFAEAMRNYCQGALEHVEDASNGTIPNLEEYLAIHRKAAGVTPIFALVEYAQRIDVPDEVFEHDSIQEIQRVGTDVVLIQNDIASYRKEEAEGVHHNIVAVCRNSGLTAQQAFDRVGELLKERYRDWYLAQAHLPQWGEKTDTEVQKYIKAVHNTMLANLNFSFKSKRYFGDMRDVTRTSRTVMVLKGDA